VNHENVGNHEGPDGHEVGYFSFMFFVAFVAFVVHIFVA
jgi:hypothetical protein